MPCPSMKAIMSSLRTERLSTMGVGFCRIVRLPIVRLSSGKCHSAKWMRHGRARLRVLTWNVCSALLSDPYAGFQRLCGLYGPRDCKKTGCRTDDRSQGAAGRHRARQRSPSRRIEPRRPHQRRGPHHSGNLFRRDAQLRRRLPGNVSQGEERAREEIQGRAMRISRDKAGMMAKGVMEVLKQMEQV